jgi:hypothetical protein
LVEDDLSAIWREPSVRLTLVLCFAMLVPIGLTLPFVERLQTVAAGLVVGIGTSLFVAGVVNG